MVDVEGSEAEEVVPVVVEVRMDTEIRLGDQCPDLTTNQIIVKTLEKITYLPVIYYLQHCIMTTLQL